MNDAELDARERELDADFDSGRLTPTEYELKKRKLARQRTSQIQAPDNSGPGLKRKVQTR